MSCKCHGTNTSRRETKRECELPRPTRANRCITVRHPRIFDVISNKIVLMYLCIHPLTSLFPSHPKSQILHFRSASKIILIQIGAPVSMCLPFSILALDYPSLACASSLTPRTGAGIGACMPPCTSPFSCPKIRISTLTCRSCKLNRIVKSSH